VTGQDEQHPRKEREPRVSRGGKVDVTPSASEVTSQDAEETSDTAFQPYDHILGLDDVVPLELDNIVLTEETNVMDITWNE